MRFRKLPADLQERVFSYYEYRYQRKYFDEREILHWRYLSYPLRKVSLLKAFLLFEHTCAYRFLSVRLSVTGPKLGRLENNSYFNKQSRWHVSRLDISCDGSKSACLCHGKCNNVAHEESRSTTGFVYVEIPKAFHVVCAI